MCITYFTGIREMPLFFQRFEALKVAHAAFLVRNSVVRVRVRVRVRLRPKLRRMPIQKIGVIDAFRPECRQGPIVSRASYMIAIWRCLTNLIEVLELYIFVRHS